MYSKDQKDYAVPLIISQRGLTLSWLESDASVHLFVVNKRVVIVSVGETQGLFIIL